MSRPLVGRKTRELRRKRREKARNLKKSLLQVEAVRAKKTGGPVSVPNPIGKLATGLDGREWMVMNVWDPNAVRSRNKGTFGDHVLRWQPMPEMKKEEKPSLPPAPPLPESEPESVFDTEPAQPVVEPEPVVSPSEPVLVETTNNDLNILQPVETTSDEPVKLTETGHQDDVVQII